MKQELPQKLCLRATNVSKIYLKSKKMKKSFNYLIKLRGFNTL